MRWHLIWIRAWWGTWQGIDSTGVKGGFTFKKNGDVVLIKEGKPVNLGEKAGKASWTTDAKKTPMQLNLILSLEGKEARSLPMIYNLLDSQRIMIRQGQGEERPTAFVTTDDHSQIILNKQ
ncbi:MAG: hypothetical protein Q9M28_12000 [Mariprofundaceae bacterium]|nr:hypothetical protein [Mariprofundaceae bacterium]